VNDRSYELLVDRLDGDVATSAGTAALRRFVMVGEISTTPADRELATETRFTWYALSRATHHHPYELDPTREELSSLLRATRRLITATADA
jgi:hypothetical protein